MKQKVISVNKSNLFGLVFADSNTAKQFTQYFKDNFSKSFKGLKPYLKTLLVNKKMLREFNDLDYQSDLITIFNSDNSRVVRGKDFKKTATIYMDHKIDSIYSKVNVIIIKMIEK